MTSLSPVNRTQTMQSMRSVEQSILVHCATQASLYPSDLGAYQNCQQIKRKQLYADGASRYRGDLPRRCRARRENVDPQLCFEVAADRKTVDEFLRPGIIVYNIRWRPVNRENEDGSE